MQVQAHNWEEIAQLCALKHDGGDCASAHRADPRIRYADSTYNYPSSIALLFRQDVCCSNISAVGLVAARADWDYTNMATVCCSLH
jgi:hypothetical protein